eukprot:gene14575-16077_t
MDTIFNALDLITNNCWMASIDLKDAYYSVKIHDTDQKYLKFYYQDQLYKYTVYPNGLAFCPRKFTKLLKLVLSTLRKKGLILCAYIDDLLLVATTYEKCVAAVLDTIKILDSLGFVVHTEKSIFSPQNHITFLGFEINSISMKITLTKEKVEKMVHLISVLIAQPAPTIREVAKVIGYIISSLPAVRCGQCHYRQIENDKISSLKAAQGNFDRIMHLSDTAIIELRWWVNNIPHAYNFINKSTADITINSDASLLGWGAVMGDTSTGGHWTPGESQNHINYLELLAVYFALKSFKSHIVGKHVKIMIDNTTAVAVVNNMGTCHSVMCNSIACEIWLFCEDNNIWLTAAHIPGSENTVADLESRNKNSDTEWMLDSILLHMALQDLLFSPCIDLFASRLNKQFDSYISYRPDPYAKYIDAFTISWADQDFYCFPPFSCIQRTIKKIIQEKAQGILVVPHWTSQTWYPMLIAILQKQPVFLKPKEDLLTLPAEPGVKHPLHKKLTLICLVSGKIYC